MAIEASVGQEGVNAPSDVRVIQAALNAVMHPEIPLAVDGLIGPKTIGMITSFQDDKVGLRRPDGRVDPGGRTLRTLHSLIPKALTRDQLTVAPVSFSRSDRTREPVTAAHRGTRIGRSLRGQG